MYLFLYVLPFNMHAVSGRKSFPEVWCHEERLIFILLLSWSDLTLSAPLKHGTKRSQRDKQRNYQSSNRTHTNLAWPYWQSSRATHHQHYHQKPVSHVSLDSTSAMRQNCEMQHGVSDVNQTWEITQEICLFFLSICSHAWLSWNSSSRTCTHYTAMINWLWSDTV